MVTPLIPNVWYPTEHLACRGELGPAFAIYKLYLPDRDEFRYIGKHFPSFHYETHKVLDEKLRLVCAMPLDAKNLANGVIAPSFSETEEFGLNLPNSVAS